MGCEAAIASEHYLYITTLARIINRILVFPSLFGSCEPMHIWFYICVERDGAKST
jgi:hypothetical protein